MAIRNLKPTTAGQRGMTTRDFDALTKKRPTKSLLTSKRATNGRNARGKITVRHRGGGVKRFYRLVDFNPASGTEATIKAIEYDPNRSANIALIEKADGVLGYVLAGSGMRVGTKVTVGEEAEVKAGNRLPLRNIPLGSTIYAIELKQNRGGQLVRSAGARAQLVAKEGDYGQVRLPSGEVRLIHLSCYATLGSVGNEQHQNVAWGKAGRIRKLGRRPTVHGKAMNPADHPLGGGEGKTGPGRHPRTPWGKPAIGHKTRRRKSTAKMIVRSRKEGRR